MRRKISVIVLAGLVMTWSCPGSATADTGPYLWHLPFAGLILLVVVVVEGVAARAILNQSWRLSLGVSLIANVASAAVGIALAAMLALSSVFARTISEASHGSLGEVWGGLSTLLIAVSPFFISVAVEYYVARGILMNTERRRVRKWAWTANSITYGGLWLLIVLGLLMEQLP